MRDKFRHSLPVLNFPFLFPDLRPVRASVKARPEDFVVEEVLAVKPRGEGEHLLAKVEKTGWSMGRLLKHLCAVLAVKESEIGYAGLKDKVAVSTQWISLPARCEEKLATAECSNLRVLEAARHDDRLRTGQLFGNRFRVKLRGASGKAAGTVREILTRIAEDGMPNIYGNQRFGHGLEAVRIGRDVVQGTASISGMSRLKRRFVVSAVQSYLFNVYVFLRMETDPHLTSVLPGDVMKDCSSGGFYHTRSRELDQRRVKARTAEITGPLFGRAMVRALDEAHVLEARAAAKLNLLPTSFDQFQVLAGGTRRNLLVRPTEPNVEASDSGLVLSFFLPRGSFATVLVREILKKDV
jgi:tRNA pseudouridine13 synthase